jgi:import inner membrane translocase subunit TIM22
MAMEQDQDATSTAPAVAVDAPSEASTSTAVAASGPGRPASTAKKYAQLVMPSPQQIYQEDVMNNCAVKSVISCVMGGLLGVVFGIFSVSMEGSAAVRRRQLECHSVCR